MSYHLQSLARVEMGANPALKAKSLPRVEMSAKLGSAILYLMFVTSAKH